MLSSPKLKFLLVLKSQFASSFQILVAMFGNPYKFVKRPKLTLEGILLQSMIDEGVIIAEGLTSRLRQEQRYLDYRLKRLKSDIAELEAKKFLANCEKPPLELLEDIDCLESSDDSSTWIIPYHIFLFLLWFFTFYNFSVFFRIQVR